MQETRAENRARKSPILGWLLEKTGLDSAVIFTLLTRVVQATAGLVTLVLIARFFAPEVQGFYYTFVSLLALQAFLELGFYIVIVSRASHEWSKLRIDDSGYVVGDISALSRLGSLARFIAKWYTGVAFLFVLGVGVAGHVFLSTPKAAEVGWIGPWWAVVSLAAVQLWLMPVLSLLEGCNQVVAVNRFRLAQSAVEAVTVWLLLVAGAGLWVLAGSLAIKAAATLVFLGCSYRRFFRSILESAGLERMHWGKDIWPMQWRLAVMGAVNYFVYSLFTPVMFHFHGPTVAGQMGMTLQIIGVIQMMAMAWIQTKVPRFGMLVASRAYAELDNLWWRVSKLSLAFAIAGSALIWGAVLVLHELEMGFASRILGPLPTALFLAAYGLMQIVNCYAAYLRAHAREPFLLLGVSSGPLIGGLVLLFGSNYGPTGAAASFMLTVGLYLVPMSTLIWTRRRAEWRISQEH